MQPILSITTLLFTLGSGLFVPSISPQSDAIAKRALHPCGVEVQRWCWNCSERFEVYYYNAYPVSSFVWDIAPWWEQTTLSINIPNPGDELIPIQVGSNILHVWDTEEPVRDDHTTPGKLTFAWGDQKWDSFSAGSPCNVTVAPTYSSAEHYSCTYQCDK